VRIRIEVVELSFIQIWIRFAGSCRGERRRRGGLFRNILIILCLLGERIGLGALRESLIFEFLVWLKFWKGYIFEGISIKKGIYARVAMNMTSDFCKIQRFISLMMQSKLKPKTTENTSQVTKSPSKISLNTSKTKSEHHSMMISYQKWKNQ